jgi:hypothetical protein
VQEVDRYCELARSRVTVLTFQDVLELSDNSVQGSIANEVTDVSAFAEDLQGRCILDAEAFSQAEVLEAVEHVHLHEADVIPEDLGKLFVDGFKSLTMTTGPYPELDDDSVIRLRNLAVKRVRGNLTYFGHHLSTLFTPGTVWAEGM